MGAEVLKMKRHLHSCCVPAAAAMMVSLLLCMPAAAQNDATVATPRAADGHPDLSGYYANHGTPTEAIYVTKADGSIAFVGAKDEHPDEAAKEAQQHKRAEMTAASVPYKPEFAAKVKAILDSQIGDASPLDPGLKCQPLGIPREMGGPMLVVQTPGLVVILFESTTGEAYRVIPTDGRPHRKDLDPAYLGDSVGHWQGDTLIVDVTGLNDETWLGNGGLIHSDQEHVTERYSRKGNVLTYEATVEDPVMFIKPWMIAPRHFTINNNPQDQMLESVCFDGDSGHISGGESKK
jgi:hypothetical protein